MEAEGGRDAEMILGCFLIAVALATIRAAIDWRQGIYLALAIAMLGDPIRKIIPGQPAWLLLSTLPIYGAMLLGLGRERRDFLRPLLGDPLLRRGLILGVAAMGAGAVGAMRHGWLAFPLILSGVFSYAGGVPAVALGYFHGSDKGRAEKALQIVLGLIAVALVGGVFHAMDYKWPVLGTVSRGEWIRYYIGGRVAMVSGFLRSPESAGWYGAFVACGGLMLLFLPERGVAGGVLTGWGILHVLLSGRRKMLAIVVLVALIMVVIQVLSRPRAATRIAWRLVLGGLLVAGLLGLSASRLPHFQQSVEATTATDRVAERLSLNASVGLYQAAEYAGPVGRGIGIMSQAARQLGLNVELIKREGGLERLVIELGWFGAAILIVSALHIGVFAWRRVWRALESGDVIVFSGTFGLLVGSLVAFVFSHQLFSDPMVGLLLGWTAGLSLRASEGAATPNSVAGELDVPRRWDWSGRPIPAGSSVS